MTDFDKIKELLLTISPCDPDEITLNSHLVRDLDIDSFGLMELVLDFEEEFHISIPDRDLRQFNTVADVVTYIEKKQRSGVLARAAT